MKKYFGLVIVIAFVFSIGIVSNANANADAPKEMKKCRACHALPPKCKGKGKKQGPNLTKSVKKGATAEWLDKWIKDPKGTWKAGGGYTDTLKKYVHAEKRKKPEKTKMLMGEKKDAKRKVAIAYILKLSPDDACDGKPDKQH